MSRANALKLSHIPGTTLGLSVVPRRLAEAAADRAKSERPGFQIGPASRRTGHAGRVRSPGQYIATESLA